MSIARLSIIGFGLIGASVAKAARRYLPGCVLTAYDHNPESVHQANEDVNHAFDDASGGAAASVGDAQCVILCVPPDEIAPLLQIIAGAISPTAIVTDVTSVKQGIVQLAEHILPSPQNFVGGHPMAGSERGGHQAARADLFQDAPLILTPTEKTDPGAVDIIEQFWTALGARPRRMSPTEHDRLVAEISHLPHVLASALVTMCDARSTAIAGSGFRDVTRIAAGDAALWRQILQSNRLPLSDAIRQFRKELDIVEILLHSDQSNELDRWLREAAASRRQL